VLTSVVIRTYLNLRNTVLSKQGFLAPPSHPNHGVLRGSSSPCNRAPLSLLPRIHASGPRRTCPCRCSPECPLSHTCMRVCLHHCVSPMRLNSHHVLYVCNHTFNLGLGLYSCPCRCQIACPRWWKERVPSLLVCKQAWLTHASAQKPACLCIFHLQTARVHQIHASGLLAFHLAMYVCMFLFALLGMCNISVSIWTCACISIHLYCIHAHKSGQHDWQAQMP
jgi:hypothetical protein